MVRWDREFHLVSSNLLRPSQWPSAQVSFSEINSFTEWLLGTK